ncbi:MAG TPA: glycosyltransferase, partial [Candidatus Levybacteria bacterium]|nr:glycosyltransferase [Candidatus Levybacteria bacterium]
MKILITGGHFSPAYSVIQELHKQGHEVTIVGRVHPFEGDTSAFSYEYRVSKELNVPFITLSTGRFQRR